MAKDPAFLFYTGDFSTGTQFFSDEQLGKYVRLLMAQHQHGHLTEKQMLHICKSYDNDIFIKFKKDDNDMFFNERLELEIFKRKKYTDSRSNNKSGRKSSLNKESTKNTSKSYDKHMEDVNENRNEDKDFERSAGENFNEERETQIVEATGVMMKDFKFSSLNNPNKQRQISGFIRKLFAESRIEYFIEQYPAYWEFKHLSGAEKQSLDTFINGGWDRENWVEKLKEIKRNGTKSTTPDAKRASRYEVADKLNDMLKGNTGG